MEESSSEKEPAGDAVTARGLGGCDVGRPGVGRTAPARPLGRPGTSLTLIAGAGNILAHLSQLRDPAEVKAGLPWARPWTRQGHRGRAHSFLFEARITRLLHRSP